MANIFESMFGWTQKKTKEEEVERPSFAPEVNDDGAMVVAAGGAYGSYVDLEGSARSEAELVARYRDMAQHAEVDSAITSVVDEAIVMDEDYVVRIILDKVEESAGVKKKIEQEFENVLALLDFDQQAHDIFKRWYIDGRLYYHAIIDPKKPQEGLKELRYVDPRNMRKVREVERVRGPNGISLTKTKDEYFVYNERGFSGKATPQSMGAYESGNQAGLKITLDAMLYCTSGVLDPNNQLTYSHLHKAIKPLNQLRVLEDSIVIYRISRAPERRIFYLDVGNLPKAKAEQYMREVITTHKNRLVYDAGTGEVRDDRKFMTMMEDYWFARRDGGRGTEVTTLPAGQNLGELTDVEYFQKKLYKALGVPGSRLDPDLGMALGRASEISRDEVQFSKLIGRMRRRFSQLLLRALEKQLILKKIILPEEWAAISRKIKLDYVEDNHFAELKNLEITSNRLQVLALFEPYIGITHSWEFVRKNLMKQTEEEREYEDKRIAEEKSMDQFMNSELKMQKDQIDMGLVADPTVEPDLGEEEEPESLGEPTKDPNPKPSEEDDANIGKPTKPPFGKKNGPDVLEGQKSKPKPEARKKPQPKKKP